MDDDKSNSAGNKSGSSQDSSGSGQDNGKKTLRVNVKATSSKKALLAEDKYNNCGARGVRNLSPSLTPASSQHNQPITHVFARHIMPRPSEQGAPAFDSKNLTRFLEDYEEF